MRLKYFLAFALFVLSTCGCAQENHNNASFQTQVVELTLANHIAPKPIDDVLSKELFSSFLRKIDPDKKIFLLQEVEYLKRYEDRLDDELKNGTTLFFDAVFELFQEGLVRAEKEANNYLAKEIDIFKVDYFESDPDKVDFLDEAALEKRWAMMVKKQYLEEIYLSEIVQPNLDFTEHRAIALQKTNAFFRNYFQEMRSKTKQDIFELYVNTYLSLNDYQSGFLSPKSKAEWYNNFTRNFVGVGISIKKTLDYPEILDVLFNGPAYKTQKINSGDILLKVSNEKNQLIDVAGMPTSEIIDLLKGNQGSKVTLRIKNATNEIEDIELERGPVELSKAMSFILENKTNKQKTGYIFLPRFYAGGENCSAHVLEELNKLKLHHLDGIILDLRNNQGGSAREAREIIGYFLQGESVMQTVYAHGEHRMYYDEDSISLYSGKLLVLVNENSSSASELLSGTLQDYHRAIIVGTQTYGKGTVQQFFELTNNADSTLFGDVKLSMAKFYTGNGRSTQYHGITPDIVLPSEHMFVNTGERAVENTLQFEDLEPVTKTANPTFEETLGQLARLSQERQSKNEFFLETKKEARQEKLQQEKTLLNLNYTAFKQEKQKTAFTPTNSTAKIEVLPSSSSEAEKEKVSYWKSRLANDEYLFESMLILSDYLQQ